MRSFAFPVRFRLDFADDRLRTVDDPDGAPLRAEETLEMAGPPFEITPLRSR